MAASAGTVTLELDANSVKLLRDLKKTQTRTANAARGMQRSMTGAFTAIRRAAVIAFSSFAGFAAIRALRGLASEAARSADALAKQADILGITTEKLAAYQLGARIAGSDNNALEKGMRRLQKAISDGADGLSTYTRAFGKLKLDPAELKRLTPDQQFEKLAEAFSHLETQTDKVSVAYDIFGGRNVALLKLLDEVGTNMRGLESDTKAWGIALTRVDAAKIEEARDQMERARTAVNGLATQLAVKLAPVIEDIARRFADAAASSDGFFASIGGAIAAGTSDLSERRAEIVKDIDQTQKLLDIQEKFSFGFGEQGSITTGLRDRLSALRTELELTDDRIAKEKELARQRKLAADLIAEIEIEPALFSDNTKDAFQRQYDEINNLAQHFVDAYATAEQKVNAELADFNLVADVQINGEFVFSQAERDRIRKEINAALRVDEIDPEDFAPTERTSNLVEDFKRATDQMQEYSKQAARNIQDAFADFLFDPFEDGLKGMIKGFLDALRRMYANQLAAKIFGDSNGGDGLFGFIGGLFGRAAGGPVQAGVPYTVGEKGKETFVPSTNGVIVPHGMGRMMPNLTFVTNISADSGPDIRRWAPLLEENNRKLKSELIDEINRGKYNG